MCARASTHALTLLKTMSTSVAVTFLSSNFVSLKNLANFALSISGIASLDPAPKEQNDLNIPSRSPMVEQIIEQIYTLEPCDGVECLGRITPIVN